MILSIVHTMLPRPTPLSPSPPPPTQNPAPLLSLPLNFCFSTWFFAVGAALPFAAHLFWLHSATPNQVCPHATHEPLAY
jgi:hypothetical protein